MSDSKDNRSSRKKRLVALPKYPGGSEAFKRFISDNLSYPEEALQKGIEGDVHLGFRVNDNGEVTEVHVLKGIGYGCDDEALRLVRMLKYEHVRNRGIRVQSSMKTKIPFRIKTSSPPFQVVYQPATVQPKETKPEDPAHPGQVYSYTIRFQKS